MRFAIVIAACVTLGLPTVTLAQARPATVIFARGDDRLLTQARTILDAIAGEYRRAGDGSIVIAGHTETAGDATANLGLSERRAARARDYLVAAGVPSYAVTVQAYGETRPAKPGPDGTHEPLNDRIEITVGPGSGW